MIQVIAAILLALPLAAAQRPWQRITVPTWREAAANFRTPPPEYGMVLWWFWNGPMTQAAIVRDLDDMQAHGVRSVMVFAYYGLELEYLSPQWFERIRYAIQEARKRHMRVWLMDEGSYPSGFAGGKFTREYPEQRMKALVAAKDGIRWQFRTPATRYVHNPGFPKNTEYSLFDFLDPAATRRFLALVHEQYKKAIGEEFGKTVMGFMGDETDCAPIPWTHGIYDEFQRRKGYDLRPHLPELFAAGEEARRIQADYWDVWSDRLRESFFRLQAEWCAANGLEYIVHLNSEDNMKGLVRVSGDYFRCMRHVQVPGVDAIWRQIWPGTVADFPKLASSAAHLFGHPRAFTESYAVYGRGLTLEQARWVMDHQFARGINLFQCMLYLSDTREFREYFHPPDWRTSPQWPQFPLLARYANRASYLLAIGRPAARIALYYPTTSLWLGDDAADRSAWAIARHLLETQRDFDFIDEQALGELAALEPGALRNLSGQSYRAVVVPSIKVISKRSLDRLRAFARSGGRVIFAGGRPDLISGRSFRDAAKPAELDWALRDLDRLPESDVTFDHRCPEVKCLHREWRDADLYYFFNESAQRQVVKAALAGRGQAQQWDPYTGEIQRLARGREFTLDLEPFESRFVVVAQTAAQVAGVPAAPARKLELALEGPWTIDIAGQRLSAPLRTWAEMGLPGYSGAATYRKEFTMHAAGISYLLDCGEVRYSARVRLNGMDLGARAWRPFRWDLTKALHPGKNVLEIEVFNTAANELAGDPARLRAVEEKGWLKNSYIRIYGKFDAEMVPAGLIGPVRIESWKP